MKTSVVLTKPVRLGEFDDLVHHLDTRNGIKTRRGLCREHYKIRPVKDRISNITNLGACRDRMLGHAFEHLGRGNYKFPGLITFPDDLLLNLSVRCGGRVSCAWRGWMRRGAGRWRGR